MSDSLKRLINISYLNVNGSMLGAIFGASQAGDDSDAGIGQKLLI